MAEGTSRVYRVESERAPLPIVSGPLTADGFNGHWILPGNDGTL